MYASALPKPLVQNPDACNVSVGDTVTCWYSKRQIVVAAKDDHGSVWEKMEENHPALLRNGGSLPNDHLRYIGIDYDEFEPVFITQERFNEKWAEFIADSDHAEAMEQAARWAQERR